MQFQLANPDRAGFCKIGDHLFTFDVPGPADVDVSKLSPEELSQFLYNYRRGVLACNDPDELTRVCEGSWSAAKSYSTPAERPLAPDKSPLLEDVVDPIREDLKELKALLQKGVNTVKREVRDLPVGRVRKLVELEIAGKNRKSLKAFLNELLAKHAKGVLGSVGDEDAGDSLAGVKPLGSKQVTDVVDSEVEQVQVVLNPLEDTDKNG